MFEQKGWDGGVDGFTKNGELCLWKGLGWHRVVGTEWWPFLASTVQMGHVLFLLESGVSFCTLGHSQGNAFNK